MPTMPTCGLPEKNKGLAEAKPKFLLAGRVGIEPTTNELEVSKPYFHYQTLVCVLPCGSTSYSKMPATVFNRASFSDVVR